MQINRNSRLDEDNCNKKRKKCISEWEFTVNIKPIDVRVIPELHSFTITF